MKRDFFQLLLKIKKKMDGVIGILYLLFGFIAGIIGTLFSIIIRVVIDKKILKISVMIISIILFFIFFIISYKIYNLNFILYVHDWHNIFLCDNSLCKYNSDNLDKNYSYICEACLEKYKYERFFFNIVKYAIAITVLIILFKMVEGN